MYDFIINPTSSSGRGAKIWEQIEDILQENGIAYTCHFLTGPDDAAKTAGELSRDAQERTIVVLGGDGTINEVISGFLHLEHIRFAYIPTGSGNDFARSLGLPQDPFACLDMILHSSNVTRIHLGTAVYGGKKRRFAVSSGMGFDAEVCHISLSSGLKKFLNMLHIGKLVYLLGALRLLGRIKNCDITVTLDDAQSITYHDAWFATAMNMKYEGGGFMFCPNASPEDDELDFIVAGGISKKTILTYLPKALKGRHVGLPGIHILRCRQVTLCPDRPLCTHADGEHLGYLSEITYGLTEETLTMITP